MDVLLHDGDVSGFRTSALQLLGQQVHPAAVAWWASAPLVGATTEDGPAGSASRQAAAVVPRSFLRTTDLALLHTDPQRFDLLYRLLWRIVHEPRLKDDKTDYDMQRVGKMAAAVERELQALKGAVAFQPVAFQGGAFDCGWAAPQFHTTEAFALRHARATPGTDFMVASPELCVVLRAGVVHHLPPLKLAPLGGDQWRAALAR